MNYVREANCWETIPRGRGVGPSKKEEKFPLFEKPPPSGGEGGVWREWDGFPLLTGFEL